MKNFIAMATTAMSGAKISSARPPTADIDEALGQNIPTIVRRCLQTDDLEAVELFNVTPQCRQLAEVRNKMQRHRFIAKPRLDLF